VEINDKIIEFADAYPWRVLQVLTKHKGSSLTLPLITDILNEEFGTTATISMVQSAIYRLGAILNKPERPEIFVKTGRRGEYRYHLDSEVDLQNIVPPKKKYKPKKRMENPEDIGNTSYTGEENPKNPTPPSQRTRFQFGTTQADNSCDVRIISAGGEPLTRRINLSPEERKILTVLTSKGEISPSSLLKHFSPDAYPRVGTLKELQEYIASLDRKLQDWPIRIGIVPPPDNSYDPEKLSLVRRKKDSHTTPDITVNLENTTDKKPGGREATHRGQRL